MNKIIINFFLIFFFSAYPQQFTDNEITTNIELKSDIESIAKIHLDLIFTDLIKNDKFSKKQIVILNNYEVLKNYTFSKSDYLIEAKEKSGLNIATSNTLLFWRMDILSEKAYYEFYISHTEKETQKFSYKFLLENDIWKMKEQ